MAIDWFAVTYDDEQVRLDVHPPGQEAWTDRFTWDSIHHIAFKAEDFLVSDGIYVFTHGRDNSYAIPTEAVGGSELWGEILRRGLFDAELAIEAACATEGLFVWPPP